jgi:hypothetical protein
MVNVLGLIDHHQGPDATIKEREYYRLNEKTHPHISTTVQC